MLRTRRGSRGKAGISDQRLAKTADPSAAELPDGCSFGRDDNNFLYGWGDNDSLYGRCFSSRLIAALILALALSGFTSMCRYMAADSIGMIITLFMVGMTD
uniref:Uncharacterized protein n=1 Tax=Paracidobacterium acidisoli TaxID=2303751 RepID=A0A372IQX0_9BACT